MVQNSKAFSEAYSCGLGTQMYPALQCKSFPEPETSEGNNDDIDPA
jgi:hypothetical protein